MYVYIERERDLCARRRRSRRGPPGWRRRSRSCLHILIYIYIWIDPRSCVVRGPEHDFGEAQKGP